MDALALVDCNNFFVSCERVFQPGLNGRPVVVLSNNDGCIISRSNEAKAIGIKMGEPYFKARPLITQHNVHVFSANFSLYGDISNRVMTILRRFSPEVEVYSIDEAFMGLSGVNDLTSHARLIRRTLLQWIKIPVSIGVAETKTLAKITTEIAKKSPKANGVLNLYRSPWQDEALRQTPLKDVWGVGWKLNEKLGKQFKTALDLKNANEEWILKNHSVVMARTVKELKGISCLPLGLNPEPKKVIMSTRSFGYLVEHYDELAEAVSTYAARAGEKLRAEGLTAKVLYVFIKTNRHRKQEPQYYNGQMMVLPATTNYTPYLIKAALTGLKTIYKKGYRYYKAGVTLSELNLATHYQESLFYQRDREKLTKIMTTMDTINHNDGQRTIQFGAEGLSKPWLCKADAKSPAYTTRFDQLREVN